MAVYGLLILLFIIIIFSYIKYSNYTKNSDIINSIGSDIFCDNIYLDNNGTTKMCSEALKSYLEATRYGNASANYADMAREIIKKSDNLIKYWIGGDYEIIYNSGASESNSTIFKTITEYYNSKNPRPPHIITSSYEHSSILDCVKLLAKWNKIQLTLVDPNIYGIIEPENVFREVRFNTVLVSIMHINNEIGTINDIDKISAGVKRINPNIIFHTDMVQSFGKFKGIGSPYIDAISVSSHKFYGPLGIGYLIVKKTVFEIIKEFPLISGTQNYGARGGTINSSGISGSNSALGKNIQDRDLKNLKLYEMKKYIVEYLITNYQIGDFQNYYMKPDNYDPFQGDRECRSFIEIVFLGPNPLLSTQISPNTLLFSIVKKTCLERHFCNLELRKDLQNRKIIISVGSACHSSLDPNSSGSQVLSSIKAPYIIRCGVIRISLGDYNNMGEIKKFCQILSECINLQN